ncbi:E3 ubiquitin-protein ligase ZNF598 isoform X2 [Neocloeon triangulifer]|uniref:E3 ubiquitin-protein ligase ZNF598 isoform X2 n=1 Tax=Neocloeon triangulifer TaxID=2078957 RepID=UPI00286F6BC6|nr:E3 ubiquitin-protein ligase ZNF598 isoform X2 [Neocloeon triangulifer]
MAGGDDDENANTCVVCFKESEIFSVGECDHPVCFECSTRMRVLCQQTECPICRQDMPRVVFAEEVKPYKKQQQRFFEKKYKIGFSSSTAEEAYRQLLRHSCKMCANQPEFRTFNLLKDHMRKEHELFYCDLCVANLKIFSCERRCYKRPELAQHRRRGDPDDRSHRGHPLCEFCDERFMDNDELYRHMRRTHHYCHFCDADGFNRYFPTYEFLRDHFRSDHYLCEEGECKEEKFTSVFRSDIDLKAHRASIHGRALGKAATKQARTLELEFTLAPRPRGSASHAHRRQQNNEDSEGAVGFQEPVVVQQPVRPNLHEDNFPSLGGSISSTPPSSATNVIRFKGGGTRLNMTEENFPSLSAESSNVNISLQRGPVNNRANNLSNNFSIKVQHKRRPETSAPPSSSGAPLQRGLADFPSLAAPAKQMPVASSWKGKVVPKGNVVGKVVPQNQSQSTQHSQSNLLGSNVDGKSKVTVKPPSFVAPADVSKAEESKSSKSKKKKNKGRQNSTSPLPQVSSNSSVNSATSSGTKSKKTEDRKCSELQIGALQEDLASPAPSVAPPPGFACVQTPVSPPPGFSVTLNSVARPANGLTFTNSCGESFPIRQTAGVFIQPTNSKERNSQLVQRIQALQTEPEGFNKFCQMSSKFRRGQIEALEYYNHCRESVGDKEFVRIFPELLALLPDIRKQQELWLAHGQKGDFIECVTCGQVLSSKDKKAHIDSHVLNNNFPSLSLNDGAPKTPTWTLSKK